MSWKSYDNMGQKYDLKRVIPDETFDKTAYENYSPLFLSWVFPAKKSLILNIGRTSFAISYGLSFACITATIVHSVLYFWKPIKLHLRRSLREQPDIHAKLMSQCKRHFSICTGIFLRLVQTDKYLNGGMLLLSVRMANILWYRQLNLAQLWRSRSRVFVFKPGLLTCQYGLLWSLYLLVSVSTDAGFCMLIIT